MFQQEINCFRIQLVLVLFILIGGLVGDGPSRLLAVAFVPPTVQHGEVEYAVHQSLLTGSSGSLRKTGVNPEKPDVPLNKNDAFQKVQKRRVQEKR